MGKACVPKIEIGTSKIETIFKRFNVIKEGKSKSVSQVSRKTEALNHKVETRF